MHLKDMEELAHSVIDADMKSYMHEALSCYSAGAYRGTIVLSCIAMFDDLAQKLSGLSPFNSEARDLSREVKRRREDQEVFENYLLEQLTAKGLMSQLDGEMLQILRILRNKSAHPSSHKPTAEEARWVFRECIERVLSKESLNTRAAAEQLLEDLRASNFFPRLTQESVQGVVTDSLGRLHQSSHNYLIAQIMQRVSEGDDNATRFLWGLAMQASDELRPLLHEKCIRELSKHSEHRDVVVAMICADGELWTRGGEQTHDRVDGLIEEAFGNESRPLVRLCSVPLSPGDLLAALTTQREEAEERFRNIVHEGGLIERFFGEAEFARVCLKHEPLREPYRELLFRHAGSRTYTEVMCIGGLSHIDEDLAEHLPPEDCLRLLHALAGAAENGAYTAENIAEEHFASLPAVKEKAASVWSMMRSEVGDWSLEVNAIYQPKIMRRLEEALD